MNFQPHSYQSFAIDFILSHPIAAILLDMGLGKTVITLTAVEKLLHDSFEVSRVLVIAPLRVAAMTWPNEIRQWEHLSSLTYSVAVGNPNERRAAALQDAFDGVFRADMFILEFFFIDVVFDGVLDVICIAVPDHQISDMRLTRVVF